MFNLNEKISNDTFQVCDLNLCRVRLMNDCQYPWLILIPKKNDITELHHLSEDEQTQLMKEVSMASVILETACQPTTLNVAALGNIVRQLHVHVVARFEKDAAWPGPIWGAKPALPYESDDFLQKIQSSFKEFQRNRGASKRV